MGRIRPMGPPTPRPFASRSSSPRARPSPIRHHRPTPTLSRAGESPDWHDPRRHTAQPRHAGASAPASAAPRLRQSCAGSLLFVPFPPRLAFSSCPRREYCPCTSNVAVGCLASAGRQRATTAGDHFGNGEVPMLRVRNLVFAGALLAVVPFAAVGQEKVIPKAEPKAMPPATTVTPAPVTTVPGAPWPEPCPPAPCPAPTTRKVCKMVPTQVQETRTVMKQVQKQVCYTAYREETVQEKKCVPVTTYKKVTETVMEQKTVCVKIPCMEEKVVMEKRKKIEWVTECKTKTKVSFHKECKTIGGKGCLGGKLGGCCGDKCGGGCGDGCGGGCGGISIPVWKPHCETYTTTCRVPKCTYECVPVCKKVCTYRTEMQTKCVPVCKTRC